MWLVHTCFRACRNETVDTEDAGFLQDGREKCAESSDKSLLCVEPSFPCENMYSWGDCSARWGDICFDDDYKHCINFLNIVLGIIVGNAFQFLFDVGLLYSLEMLYEYS